ncbi:hypothetical protein H8959_016511, partial [Pygathrix nigripes]
MPSTLKGDGRSWLAEVQFVYQGLGGKGGRRVSSNTRTAGVETSGSGDVKATVAVLSFILSSEAKHSVDGESLDSELQQLGAAQSPSAVLQALVVAIQLGGHLTGPLFQVPLCHLQTGHASPMASIPWYLAPTPRAGGRGTSGIGKRGLCVPEVQRNLVLAAVNHDVIVFLPTLFDVSVLSALFGQVKVSHLHTDLITHNMLQLESNKGKLL